MSFPTLRLAYLFWLPSLMGVAGLHRFYLGKPLSGLVYLMTGGLLGLGTLYDALTMPQQVQTARLNQRLNTILDTQLDPQRHQAPGAAPRGRDARRRSVERDILALAAERHGLVTPSRVALHAQVSVDRARRELDRLIDQGVAELRVTADGVLIYVFPEFLDTAGRQELDDSL